MIFISLISPSTRLNTLHVDPGKGWSSEAQDSALDLGLCLITAHYSLHFSCIPVTYTWNTHRVFHCAVSSPWRCDGWVHRSVTALPSAAAAMLWATLGCTQLFCCLLNVYLWRDLYSLLSKLCLALHVRSSCVCTTWTLTLYLSGEMSDDECVSWLQS